MKPEKILAQLGITTPEEICIEAIAASCGATIFSKSLVGCEARLLGKDDEAIIAVNNKSSWKKQRFSAAHEIGHWLNDKGKIASCTEEMFINRWKQKDKEMRANRFAADLLLPKSIFTPHTKDKPVILDSVRDLATLFQTSLTATAIRLVEHGPLPAMVVCSGKAGRKWFISGPDVPDKLFPSDQPGTGTVAHNLVIDNNPSTDSVHVKADQWFDLPDSDQYWVSEDSVLVAPDTVLSLIWWEDESQIEDIYENEDW